MKAATCERTWQAEALEDGRLVGPERASFERHALGCRACQREVAGLGWLRESLGQAGVPPSTPFEHHIRRKRLVRAANRQLVGSRAQARLGREGRRAAAIAAVAIALCAAVFWVRRGLLADRASATARPEFEVVAIEDASWVDRSEGRVGRVAVRDGAVSVHVRHLRAGQRFLMTLPDGELEVHGTRFVAVVAPGHTQKVEVTEGVVSLRVQGEPERLLTAGQTWVRSPPAEETRVAAPSGTPVPAVPNVESAPASNEPRHARNIPAASRDEASEGPRRRLNDEPAPERVVVSAAPPDAEAELPAVDFRDAVRALDTGALERADRLFAQFARENPGDPRTEDALFLRAVARTRAGDRAGAAALARDYLARFPEGLRRNEAERLSRP
jgi:hypothetical protein